MNIINKNNDAKLSIGAGGLGSTFIEINVQLKNAMAFKVKMFGKCQPIIGTEIKLGKCNENDQSMRLYESVETIYVEDLSRILTRNYRVRSS